MLRLGITGLQLSGKSTVFAALTGGRQPAQLGGAGRGPAMHVAVVKVPDLRLEQLGRMNPGRKLVSAEVEYVDFPYASLGRRGREEAAWIGSLRTVDALVVVVRAFSSERVLHEETSEPLADTESIELELIVNDLPIIEQRLQRLALDLGRARASERGPLSREQSMLVQVQMQLEANVPVRAMSLDVETERLLRGFQLLSAKPLLVVLNVGEEELSQVASLEQELASAIGEHAGASVLAICGQLEMELVQLADDSERQAFLDDLGITELAAHRAIRASYHLCGLRSFFTIGDDEIRAWTVPSGSLAPQAAGAVHTDMQKGFIRAETVSFEALAGAGDMAAARRQGFLRQEGRSYAVADGDVIHFLFSR